MSQNNPTPSPIADLTYRNYSGPLNGVFNSSKVIAKLTAKVGMKKKGFLTWCIMSGSWYVTLLAIFYFAEQFVGTFTKGMTPGGGANPAGLSVIDMVDRMLKGVVWPDQFLNAFSIGQLFFFVIALMLGSASIANDNRANALLLYLSKPMNKREYILGKWLGVFIPLYLIVLVPAVAFYCYCYLSYNQYGFAANNPWLLPKLFILALVPSVLYASLTIGISSLFNQANFAGGTLAGLYFLPWFFTKIIQVARFTTIRDMGDSVGDLSRLNMLFHASIDGVQIAMAKILLGTSGSPAGIFPFNTRVNPKLVISVPYPSIVILVYVAICVGSLALAWNKVRAVEVV